MSDLISDTSDTGVSDEQRRRTSGLRPWKPGQSGNPDGQPKWVGKVRKALAKNAELAADVLRQVLETGSDADKVRAAKIVLEYTIPKPTEKVEHKIKTELPRLSPELAQRLAALDS